MSGSLRADLAAAATSTVLTVDQLMKAIEASHEGKEHHAKNHIGYAAVGAAVAVGALELLRRDELKKSERDESDKAVSHRHHHQDRDQETVEISTEPGQDREPNGHKRRLVEEIAGAYSLGQEIMGHRKHHVAHVVAEVLGAVAGLKETASHVKGTE